ncbi:AI-2E family transporter [Emcibacter sp. SYSU 3D8]|uniref:AI-2E family transporter n=1 Tax=Emcibacter sp. SYSU 3D8 TaxID=3133969 RepID=UPI0031FE79C2
MTISRRRSLAFWIIGFVGFLGVVWLLRSILLPFLAGLAVAYFLDPICDRLQRWGMSRVWATSVLTVAFALLVVAAFAFLLPLAVHQLGDFVDTLPTLLEVGRGKVRVLLDRFNQVVDPATADQIRDGLASSFGGFGSWIGGMLTGLLSSGLALLNVLSLIFLTPVVAFFMLRDWDSFIARLDSWIPRNQVNVVRSLAGQIDDILAAWVRGVALVCVLLAAFYAVTLSLIGLKVGLFIGIFAGFLSFVPFVGAIGGLILAVGMAAIEFDEPWRVALVAGVFLVGQALEGNWLTPMLVGEKVDLHPVAVIFALLAGGALFGFVGLLLAVPMAAVVGVLTRYAIQEYLKSQLYRGYDLPPPV